jgi:hypothetical protein
MNRDPLGLGVLLYGFRILPGAGMSPTLLASGGAWVITDPVAEKAFHLAHEGCAISTFCKNPLHPGPCKGWKKSLGTNAPGALKAIEKAHGEKLSAKRAATAEAKSAAAARVTAKGVHSPLHHKKATIKHANVLLGNDESKASGKADKVILNKTEIKRYSKIKAAHVNSIRSKHGLEDDPGLEDRLAEAFTKDNESGKDTHYRAALATSGTSMGAQLAGKHCKKGDGDCDGKAYEGLRNQLADEAYLAMLTGDDEPLDKALADYEAGKLDVTPAAKETEETKALADAWAKPAPAAEPKKAAAPAPAKSVGDMTPTEAVAAAHDMTPEDWAKLSPKEKTQLTNKVNKAYGESKPGAQAAVQKVSDLKKVAPVKKAAAEKPTVAETTPAAEEGKPFNVAKAEQLFDDEQLFGSSNSQKLVLLDDMTPEEHAQLDADTKAKIQKFVDDMVNAKGPATATLAKTVQAKLGLGPKDDDGGAVGKSIDSGLTDQEAAELTLGMSQSQYEQLTPAQKMKLAHQLGSSMESGQDEDGNENTDAAEAYQHLADMADVAAAKKAAPTVAETTPAEPDVLQGLLDDVPMATGKPDLHEMFGPDGDPDHKAVTDAVSTMSQEDYDSLTDGEKSMLDLHVNDAADYGAPGADDALAKLDAFKLNAAGTGAASAPATPGVLTPETQMAKDLAHGTKSLVGKKKLEAYEKVTGPEFQALDPDTQKLVLADLLALKDKFLDPKKKGFAQQHHDYLSKFMGGGSGAGGGSAATVGAPGDADLAKALDDIPALSALTLPPGSKTGPADEVKKAFQGFVDAGGHEKAADVLSQVWAKNAVNALDDMHADPLGTGAFTPESLALAEPALAADIKKKMLGQAGPTPHLDAFKAAKEFGDPAAADDFLAAAIKDGNPDLPGLADHHAKAVKLTSLWHDAAPGYATQTQADSEAAIAFNGSMGYGTTAFDSWSKSEGQKIAVGVMGGGLSSLGLNIDDKVEIATTDAGHAVVGALTAEMQKAVADGDSLVPKGGWAEQFHDALSTAKQAGDDLAAKNGWATDSPVVQEYKKTIMATKIDELADKINNLTPAVHPTGGAGAGGTGGSGSGKIHLGGGTDSGFTDSQNQVITGTLKSQGINLSSSAPEVWDIAVAAAAAHQAKDGLPSSLTVLDVLNATDAGHAKNLGVTNSNMLRKKVVDWLGTPTGKKYAEANSTPKSTIMGKLTGDLSIKLLPGQKVQTLSGPGPYDANHKGPWVEKNVEKAFASQQAYWDSLADVPWNSSSHGYHKAGWKTKWTNDQQDGLYSYTLGSGTINDYLRGQKKDGTPVTTASHATKQTILNIQSAMEPLQEDHLLKRGTGWEQFPPGFRDADSVKKLIGKNVTEKAFLSTSVPGGGSAGFGGPVRMEVEAPKGTHAAFVEGLSAFKGGSEQEMLLAAGQVMRVLSVKQEGHQTVVRVRIVTPK